VQFVLKLDPPRDIKLESLMGIGTTYLYLSMWNDARKFYQMAAAADPNDAESYYGIGLVDWEQCYKVRQAARDRLGIRYSARLSSKKPEQKKVCDELRAENSSVVEEGITNLANAIKLRPDYSDAMAYLNLMYRERVDLDCDDAAAQIRDLKTADEWVDKTLATMKARADKPASASESNSGQRFRLTIPGPPPPPPPPPPTAPSPR
jgi:tetratricopeptide (TPR) repeat protein